MLIQPSIANAISDYVQVPDHIMACASACRYDLYHGPCFSCIPPEGIQAFTIDHYATYADDLADCSGTVTETYTGPVGDALREFIASMPFELFVDENSGYVMESEPEGEWLNSDMEPCDSNAEGATYYEPEGFYRLDSRDIVECVFGKTIANEFS